MRIFRFMLKKDFKLVAIISLILIAFFGTMQFLKYQEAYQYEPYYSETFEKLSQNKNYYETINAECDKANAENNDAFSKIYEFMFGAEYDPYKPPREIPSKLIEKLFIPSEDGGKYSPLASTDAQMLSQMSLQLKSQSSYKQLIADQIENYDRNSRRGITDKYILGLAKKLTKDYSKVLERKFDKPVDTRGANTLITYLTSDFIPFFAVFILLFHRLSSEIQSRRFMQFSISKYGAVKFTINKMFTGFAGFIIFYLVYCLSVLCMFFAFDKNSGVISAPIQVIEQYELSPESITVFEYVLIIMLTKLVYCLALGAAVLLVSFLCKRIIVSGAAGLILTAVPIILSKTYVFYSANLQHQKLQILFSCDVYNLYHNINYLNLFGWPVKIYWVYFVTLTAFAIIFIIILALSSGKRGAAYV